MIGDETEPTMGSFELYLDFNLYQPIKAEYAIRTKRRAQRTGIQYDGQGARVLSLEDVEKRRQVTENKRKDKQAKKIAQKEKQDDRYFLQV